MAKLVCSNVPPRRAKDRKREVRELAALWQQIVDSAQSPQPLVNGGDRPGKTSQGGGRVPHFIASVAHLVRRCKPGGIQDRVRIGLALKELDADLAANYLRCGLPTPCRTAPGGFRHAHKCRLAACPGCCGQRSRKLTAQLTSLISASLDQGKTLDFLTFTQPKLPETGAASYTRLCSNLQPVVRGLKSEPGVSLLSTCLEVVVDALGMPHTHAHVIAVSDTLDEPQVLTSACQTWADSGQRVHRRTWHHAPHAEATPDSVAKLADALSYYRKASIRMSGSTDEAVMAFASVMADLKGKQLRRPIWMHPDLRAAWGPTSACADPGFQVIGQACKQVEQGAKELA